jgi:hypothetical protein
LDKRLSVTSQILINHEKTIRLRLLKELFRLENQEGIRVCLWDDGLWPGIGDANATLILNHPDALRAMSLPGTEPGLAKAYLFNDVDIEVRIEAVFDLVYRLIHAIGLLLKNIHLLSLLKQLPAAHPRLVIQHGPAHLRRELHSIESDHQAITYHYDVSNVLKETMRAYCNMWMNTPTGFGDYIWRVLSMDLRRDG